MIQRSRNSIHYWLVEASLLCSGIGLGWLNQLTPLECGEPINALSLPAAVALCGAALGGLFGRIAIGAALGVTLFCVFAVWTFWSSGF